MDNLNTRAKRILANNLYMTLATYQENKPWSTPVFYVHDEQYNFYWYSRKDTRHSLNIKVNHNVAASIFGTGNDDEGFGIYLEGTASEVTGNELDHTLEIYATKGAKTDLEKKQLTTREDFLDASPLRLYKLVFERIFISEEGKKWKGKWLDSRTEIQLK